MSAIDTLFAELRSAGRKALMPFVTAGDPDLEFTAEVLRRLVARGSGLCELGIPYSDPIADGPGDPGLVHPSLGCGNQALQHPHDAPRLTPKLPAPVVTMVSYAIIYRHGLEAYVTDVKAAGVSGLIVPDLPFEEGSQLAALCRREDVSLIQLITPTTPRDRAVQIAQRTTGFIYYVSVTGITGERTALPPDIVENVAWLRKQTELPLCIGFGISRPEHVRMLAPVADGLIVGSAIVRRMAEATTRRREDVLHEIEEYAAELLAAIP